MRTPTRKIGKYAHLKPDPNITQARFNELKKRLEILKERRPDMVNEVKKLALDGDFSENAAYQIAKGRLRGLNQRIIDIENHLKSSNIIKPSNSNIVQLGSYITVEINNKVKYYQILGSTETNPLQGIISHNSPIGSALIGHKIGDIVRIKLKNKEVEYKLYPKGANSSRELFKFLDCKILEIK